MVVEYQFDALCLTELAVNPVVETKIVLLTGQKEFLGLWRKN